jgi:hypothetical protein
MSSHVGRLRPLFRTFSSITLAEKTSRDTLFDMFLAVY